MVDPGKNGEAFAPHDVVEPADGFIDGVRARLGDHSVG
jgi:hypothetical protein